MRQVAPPINHPEAHQRGIPPLDSPSSNLTLLPRFDFRTVLLFAVRLTSLVYPTMVAACCRMVYRRHAPHGITLLKENRLSRSVMIAPRLMQVWLRLQVLRRGCSTRPRRIRRPCMRGSPRQARRERTPGWCLRIRRRAHAMRHRCLQAYSR